MKIAIIASNYLKIDKNTTKGTEIFVYMLINNLIKYAENNNLSLTSFCSRNSELPVRITSIDPCSKSIPDEKHIIFELALISKAFSEQNDFDLYHVNIGNGDIALPFAHFVKKPILITLHYTIEEKYAKNYFDLYKDLNNVFFVSTSDSQRSLLPDLNYVATIYHGIDTSDFKFDAIGGQSVIWVGRPIPQKGLDIVLDVLKTIKKDAKLYTISRGANTTWFKENIIKKFNTINDSGNVSINYDTCRLDLVKHYQSSKLFLFPIQWEEPFGLVMVESMACGTPVIAYARGSVPEIIKDGETGFIINSSNDDIRGNWIVKKTGIDGLCEAVERIYSMPEKEYMKMRENCRKHVEGNFTVEKMTREYIKTYAKILNQ